MAMVAGLAAALFVWQYYSFRPRFWSDLDQLWLGGYALRAGLNPYAYGVVYPRYFAWPSYYPLPAMLAGVLLSLVPLWIARSAFAFLTMSVATYAVARYRPMAWLPLAAGPLLHAIQRGQWSPLVLAACLMPMWQVIVAMKPTVSFSAIAYRPRWQPLAIAALIVVASIAFRPHWPLDWLDTVRSQRHLRSPLLLPGGFLLGLAALRWRRPEARLLLALAAVPQTAVLYELVPLALVPETRRESLFVAFGWAIVYVVQVSTQDLTFNAYVQIEPAHFLPQGWWALLLCGYLPILGLVLRRPNVGRSAADSDVTAPPNLK